MFYAPIKINEFEHLSAHCECYLDIQAISLDQIGLFIHIDGVPHRLCDEQGKLIYTDSLRAMKKLIQQQAEFCDMQVYLEETAGLNYQLTNGEQQRATSHRILN